MNLLTSAHKSWALHNLSKRETEAVNPEWVFTGRTTQQPPENDWHTWLILGGRGSGKTRMGAEWVSGMAQGYRPFSDTQSLHIALVGETFADVREVMIDGPSGIMSVSRAERPRFEMTRRRLLWNSGATASMFSSEDPESLRGPQFDAAWCDEISSDVWRLTGLLRGQCGTELEALGLKTEGAVFILLNDAVAPAGLKPQETGLELNWRIGASGEEFSDQFYRTEVKTGGLRALQPLSPVHVRANLLPNGDMDIRWVRRGRIDADSWLSPEIPLGEDREAYHLEIIFEGRVVRSVEVTTSNWTYGVSERLMDIGNSATAFDVKVVMISAAVGRGQENHSKLFPASF